MKTKSAKAKGRRLQNQVVNTLRQMFPQLEEDDIKAQIMGMSGEDIVFSPAARRLIKWSFECKNQERLNLWDALDQADINCPEGSNPVLIFTRNRKPAYAAIPYDVFFRLIDGEVGDETKER